MKLTFTNLCFLFFAYTAMAQQNYQVFYVELTDKLNTPYTLLRPHDFLSPRAVERRQRQGLELRESDLPIVPAYLDKIREQGAEVVNQSKWLNAVAVFAPDSLVREKLTQLPFVRLIKPLGYRHNPQTYKVLPQVVKETIPAKSNYYGFGENQIAMLQGDLLHRLGYRGRDMHVAIFDGGFSHAYRMPAFDSLYKSNRVLGTWDFVEGDEWVYESSGHGTDVLSTMGACMPNRLVGTAPDASYYLFKTEDTKGEFRIEEFNWVAAAERADSLGVDVVNSSLGYTVFRDSLMNYTHALLNGMTGIASRGADIATEKGMLIVNSAGNEGDGKWHYIGVPADAFNIIAVGATDAAGSKAKFSSFGNTADGRIKPNLSAQGKAAYIASILGLSVGTTNGTSFSSPILAGAIASLWQSSPHATNFEVKAALELTASQASQPDSMLGYGIPRLVTAFIALQEKPVIICSPETLFSTNNVVADELILLAGGDSLTAFQYDLRNPQNDIVAQSDIQMVGSIEQIRLNMSALPAGTYFLRMRLGSALYGMPVMKM